MHDKSDQVGAKSPSFLHAPVHPNPQLSRNNRLFSEHDPADMHSSGIGSSDSSLDRLTPTWMDSEPRPLQMFRAQPASAQPIFRSSVGESSVPDPAHTFAGATTGGASPLPFQAELETAFGQDFSGVQAFLGRAEPMAQLNAHAATQGERVAFASRSPGKELVAHELTHVVQNRQGGASTGVSPSAVLSGPNDAAEAEASSVARDVMAGRPVQVRAAASAGIQREISQAEVEAFVAQQKGDGKKFLVWIRKKKFSMTKHGTIEGLFKKVDLATVTGWYDEFLNQVADNPAVLKPKKGKAAEYKDFKTQKLFPTDIDNLDRPAREQALSANIKQGAMGDCWMLATIGSLYLSRPEQLQQIIQERPVKGSEPRTFQVRLRVDDPNKTPRELLIDAQLPTLNNKLVYANRGKGVTDDFSLFLPLLEKAVAAHLAASGTSAYELAKSGSPEKAFRILTGGDAKRVTSSQAQDKKGQEELVKARAAGYPMTISGRRGSEDHAMIVKDLKGSGSDIVVRVYDQSAPEVSEFDVSIPELKDGKQVQGTKKAYDYIFNYMAYLELPAAKKDSARATDPIAQVEGAKKEDKPKDEKGGQGGEAIVVSQIESLKLEAPKSQ